MDVLYNATLYKNDVGEVQGVFAAARDITERKQLDKERETYVRFFTLSSDAMCIADPFGNFKHVNPAFERLTGYAEAELVSKPFMLFILPEDREKTAEETKLQVAGRSTLNFENRYLCKDGRVALLSWVAYFDKDDGVTYASARDITQLRNAEEELRALNEGLEKRVQERTAELEAKNEELEKWNKIFVGRELRMVELKERIRELENDRHNR
jgi:PAS domain S-box-containing protein